MFQIRLPCYIILKTTHITDIVLFKHDLSFNHSSIYFNHQLHLLNQ